MHTGSRRGSAEAYTLADQSGVILGALFRRHEREHKSRETITFDLNQTRKIVETGGKYLVDNFWGKYVAIIRNRTANGYHILRDPTATLTCWHTTWNSVDVFFSHIEDCVRFIPINFTFNWKYLAMHLLAGAHLTRECGLNEVEDIPGGESLTLSAEKAYRTVLWSPVEFCRADCLEEENTAARALHNAVQTAVNAWASCYPDIVHLLSGGLDSSIVAGFLANAPSKPNVVCLNMYMGAETKHVPITIPAVSKQTLAKYRRISAHADERRFAQLVTKRWSYPLVEHQRRIPDIHLTKAWEAPLSVSPSTFIRYSDMDEVELRVVMEHKSNAVFSGYAGDTVLYATSQSLGAIDYFYRHRFGPQSIRHLSAACTLSRESFWSVLRSALKYGLLRRQWPEPYDLLNRPHLLTEGGATLVDRNDLAHPWIKQATHLTPGKHYHVMGLAHSALFYTWAFHREHYADSINPLACQPLIEVCLQIPSYTLMADGVSRGLARRAFDDVLPTEIKNRTSKGDGGPFYQEVVRTNMTFIREVLLDGILVREGLLDPDRLKDYLVDGQPFLTVTASQILDYLTVEGWLRQWTSRTKELIPELSSVTLRATGARRVGVL